MTSNPGGAAYDAARTAVALAALGGWGLLRLAGRDRLDFLQRLSTNDFRGLAAGHGLPTVITGPTAHVIAVVFAYAAEDAVLLRTQPRQASAVASYLQRMIFWNDEVEVADVGRDLVHYGLFGPAGSDLLARLVTAERDRIPMEPYGWAEARLSGVPITLFRGGPLAAADWTLTARAEVADAVWAALAAAAAVLDPEDVDLLRIEAGIPAWGRELNGQVTPLESGLSAAISYAKGCYTGQEVIARQTNFDKVPRRLVGLVLPPDSGAEWAGAAVQAGGGRPGFVGSVARSRRLGRALALAVVPRAAAEPGSVVTLALDGREVAAVVAAVPFVDRG